MIATGSEGTATRLDAVLDRSALTPAARRFVEALPDRAELPERLARMALMFLAQGQKRDGRLLARAALDLAPGDYRVRVIADWLNRRQAPLWHFPMIHDHVRNDAYARALRRFVQPGMVVFEVGTGTGILAMLAAQAGARHVYTCERRPDVAAVARDIVARNGFADRVTVLAKDAHALRLGTDLPERADLFVAEIVDNTLLGEAVLPLTELARERFLKSDAILLPRAVAAMGYLLGGAGYRAQYRMDTVMGFDLSPFNRFTPVELNAEKGGGDVDPLSEAVELIRFDLRETAPKADSRHVTLTASQAGQAECLLRWLRLDFGDGIVFENRPPQHSVWDPYLHIFPEPCPLAVGDRLTLEISHDRNRLFIVPVRN